jgi:hypothetical protein
MKMLVKSGEKGPCHIHDHTEGSLGLEYFPVEVVVVAAAWVMYVGGFEAVVLAARLLDLSERP